MEAWIRNQCSFNYRSHSIKLSSTVKSLFTGKKPTKSDTDPFLEDGIKHRQLKECQKIATEEQEKEKIWRRFSLHSFRKRREMKQEDKSKPIIPAVLSTYDKQKKEKRVSL